MILGIILQAILIGLLLGYYLGISENKQNIERLSADLALWQESASTVLARHHTYFMLPTKEIKKIDGDPC